MKKMTLFLTACMLIGLGAQPARAQSIEEKISDQTSVQAAASAAKLQTTMNKAIMSGNRSQVQNLIATNRFAVSHCLF